MHGRYKTFVDCHERQEKVDCLWGTIFDGVVYAMCPSTIYQISTRCRPDSDASSEGMMDSFGGTGRHPTNRRVTSSENKEGGMASQCINL
jgi:hypothetical protein